MQIYEIRVTPEVARLRQGDAGTRNVSVVYTFSRHPSYFAGEPPREIAKDEGLVVRQLSAEEGRQALRQGALVSAHACFSERLAKILSGSVKATPALDQSAESPDLVDRVEALESAFAELVATDPVDDLQAVLDRLPEMKRPELDAVYEQVLGKKPHGNARSDGVREAIREALTAGEKPDEAS